MPLKREDLDLSRSAEGNNESSKDYPVLLDSGNHTYLKRWKLGEGSFGKVYHYRQQGIPPKEVAVKFINHGPGLKEVDMIKRVTFIGADENNFLKVLEFFQYQSKICIVSEKLEITLLDLFVKRKYKPFSLSEIRPVAQQLLVALTALRRMSLVHCDIKPDNVMFVNLHKYPYKVKLIDFGLTRRRTKLNRLATIQILGYRAPEVVFGCKIDEPADVWSVGCVLASIPSEYVVNFVEDYLDTMKFKSLIKRLLCVDQIKRITPEVALTHSFITMEHFSDGEDDSYVRSAQNFMNVCQPIQDFKTNAATADFVDFYKQMEQGESSEKKSLPQRVKLFFTKAFSYKSSSSTALFERQPEQKYHC
uniref:Protein kinase domain-containing protein n=1 Tax=Oryzias melastigma TaxID=30732 RepID=A0A3B3CZA6_ORYME